MKVLLADDTLGYNNALDVLTQKKGQLQGALDAYNLLGIASVPATADLLDLWTHPKLFLERMLTGGQPVTFNGGVLAVEPGKVYDLLRKPAGAADFFATIQTLHDPLSNSWSSPNIDTASYELVGGAVQTKQATLDNLREQHRIYATTQRQVDEWAALQTIATALETLRQTGRFGASFRPSDYLKKALTSEQFDALNPVRANAAYVAYLA